MNVKIRPIIDHETYEVNDHIIFKDMSGVWMSQYILSPKERLAFFQYNNIVIKNPRFKKHTRATYKG
jgi:hypothetical protein